MEPLRPVVDRKLIEMIRYRWFAAADFYLRPSGAVRLNPKLAKYLSSETRVESRALEKAAGAVIEIIKDTAFRPYS